MFGLAAPAWLAALAALAVPVAIHLWTRRPARVVRVASIRHIAGAPVRARRLRLDDPWLLLVRMALLALVVVLLARPYLSRDTRPVRDTWVLVDPGVLRRFVASGAGGAASDPTLDDAGGVLDSLHRIGAPIRLFAPGLPEIAWDAGTQLDTIAVAAAWSLLREAEHVAPAGTKLLVVAPPRLGADAGERPELGLDVEWVVADEAAGAREGAAAGRLGGSAARRVGGERSAVVSADAERGDDARYIAAAIEAAAGASLAAGGVPVVPLDAVDAAAESAGPGDWIVWLAAEPMPDVLVRALDRGATVLTGGGDTRGALARGLLLSDGMPPLPVQHAGGRNGIGQLDTSRLGSTSDTATLWETAGGAPLLVARRVGRGLHLAYAGRLGPAGADLVLQPAFPELIARLWSPPHALRSDPAPVSRRQILPARSRRRADDLPPRRRDLTDTLWPAAIALLIGERLLATRRRVTSAPAAT